MDLQNYNKCKQVMDFQGYMLIIVSSYCIVVNLVAIASIYVCTYIY